MQHTRLHEIPLVPNWTKVQIRQLQKRMNKFSKKAKFIVEANKAGFNPVFDDNASVVKFICRNCGKEYLTIAWVRRHKH